MEVCLSDFQRIHVIDPLINYKFLFTNMQDCDFIFTKYLHCEIIILDILEYFIFKLTKLDKLKSNFIKLSLGLLLELDKSQNHNMQ